MQIAIISTALAIVLFLLWILIWTKKAYDELQEVYAFLARLVDVQKSAQEAQQKLYDYMDLTRREALDSYRRGLQDGQAVSDKKPVYAPQNPVKSMGEHIEDKDMAEELKKKELEFQEGMKSILEYDPDAVRE